MEVKLGEVQVTMTWNVKKTEDLWAVLRVNYTDKSKEVAFKPSEDLQVNDQIRIIIEKI
jgi:hypothetical protein